MPGIFCPGENMCGDVISGKILGAGRFCTGEIIGDNHELLERYFLFLPAILKKD